MGYKIIDVGPYWRHIASHFGRAQFGFGLGFKYRFHYLNADRRYDGFSDIGSVVIFIEMLPNRFYRFPKRRLMRSPLRGMLSIDKGVVFFAVLGSAVT